MVKMNMLNHELLVDRKIISTIKTAETVIHPLKDSEVRLRINRYAATSNNITYADFGDALKYWEFFPIDPPFGRVPAMGWATVVESNNSKIGVGGEYYGWYPMACTTVIAATATSDGFRDDGAHRGPHAAVYRSYVEEKSEPMYQAVLSLTGDVECKDRVVLLRGLFLTGYLAEDFFFDSAGATDRGEPTYFGAKQVIVMSASSKTAIGFAQRAAQRGAAKVVGVTSTGNTAFVRSIGYYDQVITYEGVSVIDKSIAAVSIDMAGNAAVLRAVHMHLGDQLKYSMTVGRSHHDAPSVGTDTAAEMPGPKPQMFFAPSEIARRNEQWGQEAYQKSCGEALALFVKESRAWMSIKHYSGTEGPALAWTDLLNRKVLPSVGVVVLPNKS
eukprot:Lankesteria_metandrocarpae@DN1538_c0_g1_i1.p1